MGDTASLLWGVVFGSMGLGFFVYGKKQRAPVPLLAGVVLSVLPYLVSNTYLLVAGGTAAVLLPYFVRL